MRKIKDNSNYKDEYTLKYEWPSDCYIQGGSNGLVLSKKGNYFTYFIEAFPKNPKCFIRGEGKSFEEAEEKAYKKYLNYSSCKKHEFEKVKGYLNGMGKCKHCGLMEIVFEPEYKCVKCGKNEDYTNIKNPENQTDCLCEECASKKENFHLLDIHFFESQKDMIRGLFKCCIQEDTFNEIIKYIENDNLHLTSEELFNILNKDENIYLIEYLKRLELLDLDSKSHKWHYIVENYCNLKEDIIEVNIVKYFYDNFIKKFYEKGYK